MSNTTKSTRRVSEVEVRMNIFLNTLYLKTKNGPAEISLTPLIKSNKLQGHLTACIKRLNVVEFKRESNPKAGSKCFYTWVGARPDAAMIESLVKDYINVEKEISQRYLNKKKQQKVVKPSQPKELFQESTFTQPEDTFVINAGQYNDLMGEIRELKSIVNKFASWIQ